MKCAEIRKLLPAYQDGEIDSSQAAEMRAHLAGCRSCQKEEELLSSSWDLLGSLKPIEPSTDFRSRLWERVKKDSEKNTRWFQRSQLAFAFGFLGLWVFGVGIGSLLFFKTGQMQKYVSPSQRGGTLTEMESPSVDSVYLKRWGGSLL